MLAQKVADVASSALSPHACAYLNKNGMRGNMAVMVQSLVGGHLPSGYFGPLFSGVLDTSSVNGEGTMTFSIVLGLGAEGAGTMHNSNILITQKGNCSPSKVQPYLRQREGVMFNSKTHNLETLDIGRLLSDFNLTSVAGAMDLFMRKYLGPLYNLSCSLSKLFGYEHADMEFAVSPLKGRKLYVLQIRESMMRADFNKEYPVGIMDEATIAKSRSVLGAITVNADALISMSSAQYLEEAENGFDKLKNFDVYAGTQGKKFMLLVPPEATSSGSEQLHPSLFNNLVFIVEKPVNGDVHRLGVSGVDHMSRLLSETNIGYMEACVNPNLLHMLPHTTHPTFTVYEGNFGAAVCSATKRGILYLSP